jgi:acyl-coenzyme A synthetase/AMP-(fatty) acid ligase
VINFYNYIHTTLTKEGTEELIVWQQPALNKPSRFTNKNLLQTISNYRQQLLHKNIKPGNTILLAMPVSIGAINALLAIQSIGSIPVLPPAKPGLLMLISVIRKQRIKIIITEKGTGRFLSFILKSAGIKCMQLNNRVSESYEWNPVLVSPEQAALITHSSGSAGKPKAIYRSHRVLSAQHLVLTKAFPPWHKQRDFPLFPNIILHNLAAGVTSVLPLVPGFKMESLNPAGIAEQLQRMQIETLTGNVFYFKKIIEHLKRYPQSFPFIKAVGVGGSPVPENLAHTLKHCFINADCYIIYGSSEAEPIAIRKVNSTIENPLNGYAVGKPCEALELRINATTEIQTAQGLFAAGEIEVKGAHVATLKKDEWLKTGDAGYVTPGNLLYLTARMGNEMPHKAVQHYQVEHLLLQQKGVENAGVISSSKGFNVFVEGSVTKQNIWEILNKHLPQGIIKEVHLRTKIPVDARHHSKILYHQLK